jgi:hypothetical protein
VSLGTNEAYADLKALLLKKDCKVVAEGPPTFISVKQDSLWAYLPEPPRR